MASAIVSGGSGGYETAVIAAVALVVGAVVTQILTHVFREKHAVISNSRSRFVMDRTDKILDWGRDVETLRFETDKKKMKTRMNALVGMFGVVARASHRQDIVLGTKWMKCISDVHSVIESAKGVFDDNPMEAGRILAESDAVVTNLLNEVEWWRLFLIRNPMPSRLRVLLRKSVSWGFFGPRRQRVVGAKKSEY